MAAKDWVAAYKLGYQDHLFSIQILLVAFGALVTVPILTGLDPAVALFTAGVATLIFHFFTKRQIPVFLASSFAYTAPIMVATQTWGIPAALGGLVAAGVVYMAIGGIIYWKGRNIIQTLFPPIVVGPIIMVIGLMLVPVAVSMALGKSNPAHLIPQKVGLLIALISLATTILTFLIGRGALKLIPIICGLIAGYLVSIPFGIIDFSIVARAPWLAVPKFVVPQFNIDAVVFLIPATVAPLIAHFGDILAIGEVADKNYLKEPGIHRTLLGNGAANTIAALVGGPPVRIYAEITGALTVFKKWQPGVMVWAAVFAMVLSFLGKLSALFQSIPDPVGGGILILFFGVLVVAGIKCLLKVESELMEFRNILVVLLILVSGIGGITFSTGALTLKGLALATLTGVILNLILPDKKRPEDS
ncbi:MAG: NCS2 family nucleobase:cation symporter [Desulfobacterales bacterium]|jgi:uracil permease|nr:NCS2 family nucleobase:cation symporter [Desulfobacterales bacterium]MDH3827962.1 NCS2 family nucleobase:cation symporter [Desulfobacterales bacterium]MDH4009062.1 NCS2 family nucleobase:cation symporter [Desulfobacterales bacterium]